MSGEVGFHGKLPGVGDFVARRLPPDFVAGWDGQFQRAVDTGRRELGETWTTAWTRGAAWRFVLPSGVCGAGSWCGLIGPAADRLGRAFPMVLAARWSGEVARIVGNDAWFDALERVYRRAQHEAVSVETFDAHVAALPGPLSGADDLSARWTELPWDDGEWHFDRPERAGAGLLLGEVWRQLGMRSGPWCLWWTAGAARLLATRGLPRSYAALLDARDAVAGGLDMRDIAGGGSRSLNDAREPAWGGLSEPINIAAPVDAADLGCSEPVDTQAAAGSPASLIDAARARHPDPAIAKTMTTPHATTSLTGLHASPNRATPTGDTLLWLADTRTLVLSADDGPLDACRVAAYAIRETIAQSAPDSASQRAALVALNARLRSASADSSKASAENGAAVIATLNGESAHFLRAGAATVWHWRRGRLHAPFVERAAGAGGELEDLLFGDAWFDMPGIGARDEPECDETALRLEAGDRLVLLVTRELTQLPRDCVADALALATCAEARAYLAQRAGLGGQPAQWPLAVLGVQA